ncbi:MAG: hypothetical protein Q9163_002833 [Psora crenata]
MVTVESILADIVLPVGALMPDLAGIQYRLSQSTPIADCTIPPAKAKQLPPRIRRLLFSFFDEKSSFLLALPIELLLLIGSVLPEASRASLALTCRALFSTFSDSTLFRGLQLPPEQPLEFQSVRMSKAQFYQPARWEFLRFLERDLNGKWYLCSECFTLHPRRMFTEYRKSIAPWLKDYYKLKDSDYRSCRHGRKNLCGEKRIAYAPSGIVDLCPCIKMSIGKKRQIEARLREDAWKIHGSNYPAADFWWHTCRQIYGDIELEVRIGLFLYDGTEGTRFRNKNTTSKTNIFNMPPRIGELGVLLEYRHSYPSTSVSISPRLLCPHRNLHTAIQDLLQCRETHDRPGRICEWCKGIQYCQYCRTKVLDLNKVENASTGIICCSYRVERCFDNNLWPMQTVFPFARRQVPLQRRSPLP